MTVHVYSAVQSVCYSVQRGITPVSEEPRRRQHVGARVTSSDTCVNVTCGVDKHFLFKLKHFQSLGVNYTVMQVKMIV